MHAQPWSSAPHHRVEGHPQQGCLWEVGVGVKVLLMTQHLQALKGQEEDGRGKGREGPVLAL